MDSSPPITPIRLALVDDHWVVRQGLRMFLERDPQFLIVGEAENGADGVRMAIEQRPDVVLMDLLMPVMDGVAARSRWIRLEGCPRRRAQASDPGCRAGTGLSVPTGRSARPTFSDWSRLVSPALHAVRMGLVSQEQLSAR